MDRRNFAQAVWAEMVALYTASPALSSLCVQVQDDHGVDVVLALFLGLADRHGLSPAPRDLEHLRQVAGDWQRQVVLPLRGIRRWQKDRIATPDEAALRDRIKANELEAERAELARLATALQDCGTPDPERASLTRYLRACGVPDARIAQMQELAAG